MVNSPKDKGTYTLPDRYRLHYAVRYWRLSWKLPGCQEAFAKFEKDIPKGNKILKEVVKSAG